MKRYGGSRNLTYTMRWKVPSPHTECDRNQDLWGAYLSCLHWALDTEIGRSLREPLSWRDILHRNFPSPSLRYQVSQKWLLARSYSKSLPTCWFCRWSLLPRPASDCKATQQDDSSPAYALLQEWPLRQVHRMCTHRATPQKECKWCRPRRSDMKI